MCSENLKENNKCKVMIFKDKIYESGHSGRLLRFLPLLIKKGSESVSNRLFFGRTSNAVVLQTVYYKCH